MRLLVAMVLAVAVPLSAQALTAGPASDPSAAADRPLRLWIDELFFAEGETVLLREAAAASGGAAEVAGTTRNRVLQLKSYQRARHVDVMWTGRVGCYEAFKRRLNATHAVSCVPGTHAVTDKGGLAASLGAAYGAAAWGIAPRSFRLPQQYRALAAHLRQEAGAGRAPTWVLKEDVHRGTGVTVAGPLRALARALERTPGGGGPRHVLAQKFVGDQLLLGGRPLYVRVWVVLMGSDFARAYVWDGGVVVFGAQQAGGSAARPSDLIVNLWTQDREAAAPWSLAQLEAHVRSTGGDAAPARLRARMHAALAAALAAALPAARREAAALPGFQGGSFEVLGADFLLDATLRPWLVEVNALPSLARKVIGGGGSGTSATSSSSSSSGGHGSQAANHFDVQKEGFVRALLQLLVARRRELARQEARAHSLLEAAAEATLEEGAPPCVSAQQLLQLLALPAEQAAVQRLGFVPLTAQMHQALACMATQPVDGSPANASWCPLLADLRPPLPAGQQQCAVPASRSHALQQLLQRAASRVALDATVALSAVRHPKTWRRSGVAALPPPALKRLSESDQRMLAWLDRGSPELGDWRALQAFCVAADAA